MVNTGASISPGLLRGVSTHGFSVSPKKANGAAENVKVGEPVVPPAVVTVKVPVDVAVPPAVVTVTVPVVAPVGTVAVIVVAVELVTVAWVPLNVTVLFAGVVSKLVPVIVTTVPTAPELGLMLETVGAAAGIGCTITATEALLWQTARFAGLLYMEDIAT